MLKNNLADAKAKSDAMEIARMLPKLGASMGPDGDLGAAKLAMEQNKPTVANAEEEAEQMKDFAAALEKNPKLAAMLKGITDVATPEPAGRTAGY